MTESANTQQPTSFNVLLIGDNCVDEYQIGTIDRLSPEAPVPVIKIVETITVPGMASNVRKNLLNLNIDPDFITHNEEILKTRYVDKRSGQHMLRVDTEPDVAMWSGKTPCPLDSYDAIVISDYNKGFLQYEHIRHIIDHVTCPIFIDTKKTRLADLARPFISNHVYIKINEVEFKNASTLADNLIVTLGDRGAQYKGKIYPAPAIEVSDVCGAGDTFLSALTYQYLLTKDIEKAILFANIAAGITVQHRGNYAPSYDEIRHAGY
jgi:D-beta-D-heptose 7-phosphate kinase/D-beta-D-heptose 1-phosphate adenosyltransferase